MNAERIAESMFAYMKAKEVYERESANCRDSYFMWREQEAKDNALAEFDENLKNYFREFLEEEKQNRELHRMYDQR